MRSAPFHNGYGLMTMQGVRKPAWRAFEALQGAGDVRYSATVEPATNATAEGTTAAAAEAAASSVSVLATNGADGSSGGGRQLFVSNWHRVDAERFKCDAAAKQCKADPSGTFTDQALCEASCGGKASTLQAASGDDPFARSVTIQLQVGSVDNKSRFSSVTVYRIDPTHANPQAVWQSWGSPQYVTDKQIAAMHAASAVKAEALAVAWDKPAAGFAEIEIDLPGYSAAHIVIPRIG